MAKTQETGSRAYLFSIVLVAIIGGLLFGYDTAVVSGAEQALDQFFRSAADFTYTPWMHGFTASSALVGCVIGGALSGLLASRLGRKRSLVAAAVLFFVSAVGSWRPESGILPYGEASLPLLASFNIYRILGGIGVGLASAVCPMYIAEISPAKIRGTLVSCNQFAIIFGMLVVYFVNYLIRTELGSQLRAYFIAKPGCVLVDADYSQIELRILAHITGDEHMQQAFLNGEDIHRSTAAKIYGIPQEEVTSRLRSSAKAINFGIMYGKGAYSLAKDIGVSVKEADAFLKNYLAAFPKVSGYMDKTIADAKACGYVSTLFGRRRALPELASSNFNVRSSGERMARNTPIQGTAADVIKLAMVRVWKRLRDEKMESRLILTVHDELIVEAPQAEAEKAAQILREEMEGCVQYAVPLSTDVHAGKNWLEAH